MTRPCVASRRRVSRGDNQRTHCRINIYICDLRRPRGYKNEAGKAPGYAHCSPSDGSEWYKKVIYPAKLITSIRRNHPHAGLCDVVFFSETKRGKKLSSKLREFREEVDQGIGGERTLSKGAITITVLFFLSFFFVF